MISLSYKTKVCTQHAACSYSQLFYVDKDKCGKYSHSFFYTQGNILALPSLSSILPQLFRAVISNAGSLNETFHLTLGLLGQLLLRISPMEADAAVTEALADKYDLLTQGETARSDTAGWRTTQLLFSLGAVCLDR